jgi:predicted DNA-binding transcriptional regulator AlpA
MTKFSTRQVAGKLGIGIATLSRYISAGKVPAPEPVKIGMLNVRAWTDKDIDRVREMLPKIRNGRKTRYQKQRKRLKREKT